MSTLTKTMVVVVSVLAIFLCGALVVFEMNQANYRQAYEDQKARTAAAMTQALAYQEETSRVKTGQEKVLAQLKDSIQLLESQVSNWPGSVTLSRKLVPRLTVRPIRRSP